MIPKSLDDPRSVRYFIAAFIISQIMLAIGGAILIYLYLTGRL